MLQPHELDRLRAKESRSGRRWVVLAVLAIIGALTPVVLTITLGSADHLAGRTESVHATVSSVEQNGRCRDVDRYEVSIAWTLDGSRSTGSYDRCRNAPTPGETVQVWVGPDGSIHSTSSTADRIGTIALSIGLCAVTLACGFAVIVPRSRRRRRLLAAGSHPLLPVGQVDLRRIGSRRPRVYVTPVGASPAHRRRAFAVLHTGPDSPEGRFGDWGRPGTWWMQAASGGATGGASGGAPGGAPGAASGGAPGGASRQVALLTRDGERFWVELSTR